MYINGKHLPNISCNKCKHRHPAEVTCQQAAEYAGTIRKPKPDDPISYVHEVPDHCDRIVWRGRYYHLPTDLD